MVTIFRVVLSDDEITAAVEKFFKAVNKKAPGAVRWDRSGGKKGKQTDSERFIEALDSLKKRSAARKASGGTKSGKPSGTV